MKPISQFERVPTSLRPLILLAILGSGLAVMRHFVNDVAPRHGFMTAESGTASGRHQTPALPVTPQPASVEIRESGKRPEPVAGTPRIGSAAKGSVPKETSRPAPSTRTDDSRHATPGTKVAAKQPKIELQARGTDSLPESLKNILVRTRLPNLVVKTEGRFIVTEPILFNTGLARLREGSLKPLDKLAGILVEHPDIRLSIIGYTDNLGESSTNQELSAERAAAVLDYLVSRGVEAARLESKGMGNQNPIASNDTQLGRQANRRIEFLVTSPK